MQSLKKIHAWAQMQVPLCIKFDTIVRNGHCIYSGITGYCIKKNNPDNLFFIANSDTLMNSCRFSTSQEKNQKKMLI